MGLRQPSPGVPRGVKPFGLKDFRFPHVRLRMFLVQPPIPGLRYVALTAALTAAPTTNQAPDMRVQLTKRLLATAEPRERPYELRDTLMKGLLLRVQPSGHKSWIIEWTRGKRRTLGAFSHLTLEQARAHAAQATAEVIQRGLPSIAKAPIATTPNLDDFLTQRYEPWATVELRGAAQYIKCIRYAFAGLLDMPLSAIDVETIDAWWGKRVTTPTVRTGKPATKTTASRELDCLRSVVAKAVEWRVMERNPLADLRKRTVESRKVVRSLSPDEEARLRTALANRDRWMVEARASGNRWRVLRDEPLYPVLPEGSFGDHLSPVILLAMNTGLRRGELLSLRWSDVDLEAAMITVRAERAKNGRQRHVPLNVEAQQVLTRWAAQRGREGQLFDIVGVKT
ncbi:MAG: DUF4102 domain-containing protein, partial [Oxalobacteraceae bacterium]